MSFFQSKSTVGQRVLVLDVGSGSIGAALVEYEKNDASVQIKPAIVALSRIDLEVKSDIAFEELLSSMKTAVGNVSQKILDSKKKSPKKIYVTLSAPWYASQSRTIVYKKNSPFVVTQKVIDELVEKEIELFKTEHINDYNGSHDTKIIEKTIQSIKLNGYTIAKPFGKKVEELELELFISMSPAQVIDAIQASVFQIFNTRSVIFSSYALAGFIALKEAFEHTNDSIVIDIGAEITDITIIKSKKISSSITFPYGVNSIYRYITAVTNVSLAEAKSYFNLIQRSHASDDMSQKIMPVLDVASKKWISMFQVSIDTLFGDVALPNTLFLTVENEMGGWFKNLLTKEDLHQYTMTDKEFNVIVINNETLTDYIRLAEGVVPDAFLILESLFIKRFIEF